MKLLSFTLLFFASTYAWSTGKLLLIGGGEKPQAAMERFVEETGENGLILVIAWASNSPESGPSLAQALREAQASKVEVIDLPLVSVSDFQEKLKRAQGVFFSGGDQNRLMEVIERYKLHEAFRERFAQGTIFAGTSAGTAIMSQKMLTGRGVETSQGLGLLPAHYIVDQHFLVRNRWQRLADVVLTHQLTGIGIDEDNALFIKNESAEVIGPTAVQLLRIQDRTIETSSFKNGETFSLK